LRFHVSLGVVAPQAKASDAAATIDDSRRG